MGLFQHKKKSLSGEELEEVDHYFDEYFREELRSRGRWYFEKVINENGMLFKQDLASTIVQINAELKEHVTQQLDAAIAKVNDDLKNHVAEQLDAQLTERVKVMQEAQDRALQALTDSAETLRSQHRELRDKFEQEMKEQSDMMKGVFEDNKHRISEMQGAQDEAVKTLNESVTALREQHQKWTEQLQSELDEQKEKLTKRFEENMVAITEQYLLGAVSEQFDIKAQLPSIIKQMEDKKQAIVDDMKL